MEGIPKLIAQIAERVTLVEDENLCPNCDGYGNKITDEGAEICDCLHRKRVEFFRKNTIPRLVGPKTSRFSFANAEDTECIRIAKKYVEIGYKARRNLIMTSSPGCGKTVALTCILKELATRHKQLMDVGIKYKSWPRFCLSYLSADFEDKDYFRDSLEKAPLLIFEDYGWEHRKQGSTFIPDMFSQIMEYRHSMSLPTIITSNMSVSKFLESMQDRIRSRLLETDRTEIFTPKDQTDMRQAK